jgi:tetratricopeptide (TPR) repeat protein
MIKKMKKSAELIFNEAQLCEKKNAWHTAVELYTYATKLRPDFLEAHHNLALALRHTGQTKSALKSAQSAAALGPNHPTVQFSLGYSLELMGFNHKAIKSYNKSVELRPYYVAALTNLGRLLEVQGNIPKSIEILERAFLLEPDNPNILLNLANSLLLSGQPQRSIQLLQNLIDKNPTISDVLYSLANNSMGVAASLLKDHVFAKRNFRKAIKLSPSFAEAHENLAQSLLAAQEYKEGWAEYEWRWKNENNSQTKIKFNSQKWNGEKLGNKTLLVHTEQGFGDAIQFIRLIHMIKKQKGNIILACPPSLLTLFSTINYIDKFIDISSSLPSFDYHVPLLSLPRILNIDRTNIPRKPYIKRDYKNKPVILRRIENRLNVGLTWMGKERNKHDPFRNRSCSIKPFEILFKQKECIFYGLQHGNEGKLLKPYENKNSIINLSEKLGDFAQTAKIIGQLDLLISIDTYAVHLAGAMGVPTWIILPFSSDWRWHENLVDNTWYPSVRLFKQKLPGDWSHPMSKVAAELKLLIP